MKSSISLPGAPTGLVSFAALLLAGSFALAQTLAPPPPPMPPDLEPVPEIPPPPAPPGAATDPELEPQVTITRKEGQTIEEARVNGKLVWIKVTPQHGIPYFLVPDNMDGFTIRRGSLDNQLRVPLWLLFSF